MKKTVISLENVTIQYIGQTKDTTAVKNCSLCIYENEILGLVGESGSGKSTILHGIFRSLPPPGIITSGKILFGDIDILQLPEKDGKALRWTKFALVVQSALNSLHPVQTILAHFEDSILGSIWENHPDKMNWFVEQLELVELDASILHRYPHELSGGMRQRVVIALALLLRPRVLIFDEPTTALDHIVETEIIHMLVQLQQKLQFCGLFISHDIATVKKISHRIAVMKDGVVLEVCDANDIDTQAKHPYTQQLLTCEKLPPKSTRTHSENPILSIERVHKTFTSSFGARTEALRDISFNIHQGECVALVGGSGSGKSTLGKIITGLQKPTTGNIRWIGQEKPYRRSLLLRQPPSSIQMIFQNPFDALNNTKTIYHHLYTSIQHRTGSSHDKQQEIEEILEQVGLQPQQTLSKFPHELSGGQRQRVSIARALLGHPKILVADEPTSMLDVSLRSDIVQLLQDIQTRFELAVILITHDMTVARFLADRCIVLCNGEIAEQGPTEIVFSQPKHAYTKQLLGVSDA